MQIDWDKAKALHAAALERDPKQRAALLDEACGAGEEALRAEVEKLLDAHAKANPSFLENPVFAATASFVEELDELIGERFGPYRIVSKIGSGGMGAVFLAERVDGELEMQVAIKVMRGNLSAEEVARFKRERQILAQLNHPNIARLYDAGTLNGRPYVVMELIEGRSLREWLKERGTLPVAQAVAVAEQVCAGLSAAHRLGVVHRDIKPENLMVVEREGHPLIKIVDFGIARANVSAHDANQTHTGVVMGTAAYMSPEQASGATHDQIDERSDVYSLGIVLYEMLTGRVAFTGASPYEVIGQHLRATPAPLHRARAESLIPPAIKRVVLKALAKDREHRQQTATALVEDLQQALLPQRLPVKRLALFGALILLLAATGWYWFKQQAVRPASEISLPLAEAKAPETSSLTYRVFKRSPNGAAQALGLEDGVQSGDEIYLEITPPYQCAVYLLYEDRQGTLVWANPKANRAPQIALRGQPLRVPERNGVMLDPPARKQNFLLVYVPDSVNWSLEDAVLPERITVKIEEVFIPYARLSATATQRLRMHLSKAAESLDSPASPVAAVYTLAFKPEERTRYHRVTVRQTQ